MNDPTLRHKNYLIDVKPLPLRNSNEWTTHFYVYRDDRDGIEVVDKIEMGNRCKSEEEAFRAGIDEAVRRIDSY